MVFVNCIDFVKSYRQRFLQQCVLRRFVNEITLTCRKANILREKVLPRPGFEPRLSVVLFKQNARPRNELLFYFDSKLGFLSFHSSVLTITRPQWSARSRQWEPNVHFWISPLVRISPRILLETLKITLWVVNSIMCVVI